MHTQSRLSSGFWDTEEDLETVWLLCWNRWRLVSFWGFQHEEQQRCKAGGASQGTLGKLKTHQDSQRILKTWSLASRHITDQTVWNSRMLMISTWVGNTTLKLNMAFCLQCYSTFTFGPKLSPPLGLNTVQNRMAIKISVSDLRKHFHFYSFP